jgi:hypothetical protein
VREPRINDAETLDRQRRQRLTSPLVRGSHPRLVDDALLQVKRASDAIPQAAAGNRQRPHDRVETGAHIRPRRIAFDYDRVALIKPVSWHGSLLVAAVTAQRSRRQLS